MDRRELLKHTLAAAGATLTGMTSAWSQEAQKKVYAGENELLKGQEGDPAAASPREQGNFNLTMRNYMPSKEIVEQKYDPPVLRRVG